MMDTTLPGVSRYLTIEEMMQGYAEVDGLTKNTLYAVNLYDTSKPRKYDKPYNHVNIPAQRSVGHDLYKLAWKMICPAMLLNNVSDPEVPEGDGILLAGRFFLPRHSVLFDEGLPFGR